MRDADSKWLSSLVALLEGIGRDPVLQRLLLYYTFKEAVERIRSLLCSLTSDSVVDHHRDLL
jgi:hypothetical protein